MSKIKDKKVIRTFIWKLNTKAGAKTLEDFQKLAICRGLTPGKFLEQVVKDVNMRNPLGFTPVSENTLMATLKKMKLSVTKVTLRKWRDGGLFKNITHETGKYWFTDGNTLVYNLEAMVDFIKNRRNNK